MTRFLPISLFLIAASLLLTTPALALDSLLGPVEESVCGSGAIHDREALLQREREARQLRDDPEFRRRAAQRRIEQEREED